MTDTARSVRSACRSGSPAATPNPTGSQLPRAAGATGVQVGTLFALSRDSNLAGSLRNEILTTLGEGRPDVRTDSRASPTGFPFKVAQIPGTLSDEDGLRERARICDLSYLRIPYVKPGGTIGYRCPAEPVDAYLRKGGDPSETVGRVCLCNALMSAVGLGQRRLDGSVEPAISTLGADLDGARELLRRPPRRMGRSRRDRLPRRRRSPIPAPPKAGRGLTGGDGDEPRRRVGALGPATPAPRDSRERSGTIVGSSVTGRISSAPAARIAETISAPRSVRTMVSVQSLSTPMPPAEMSACSAAKSGHCRQPSRVQACASLSGIS